MDTPLVAPPEVLLMLPEEHEDERNACPDGTESSAGLSWWHTVLISSHMFRFVLRTRPQRHVWRKP